MIFLCWSVLWQLSEFSCHRSAGFNYVKTGHGGIGVRAFEEEGGGALSL